MSEFARAERLQIAGFMAARVRGNEEARTRPVKVVGRDGAVVREVAIADVAVGLAKRIAVEFSVDETFPPLAKTCERCGRLFVVKGLRYARAKRLCAACKQPRCEVCRKPCSSQGRRSVRFCMEHSPRSPKGRPGYSVCGASVSGSEAHALRKGILRHPPMCDAHKKEWRAAKGASPSCACGRPMDPRSIRCKACRAESGVLHSTCRVCSGRVSKPARTKAIRTGERPAHAACVRIQKRERVPKSVRHAKDHVCVTCKATTPGGNGFWRKGLCARCYNRERKAGP